MKLYDRVLITRDDQGLLLPKPRELDKKKANCAGFRIYTTHERGVPVATVCRCLTDKLIKKDPWNDDGRPPTVLFQIYYTVISILDNSVEVTGFEAGNICLAGHMVEPYKTTKRPLANQIDDEHRRWVDVRDSKKLYPQHIVMI